MSIADAVKIVKSKNTSVSSKTRALYFLRCLDSEEAALALRECMTNESVLVDHEVAYVMGQMKQPATLPFLFELAGDSGVDPIVRHEAIEAIGNFEDEELIPRLRGFLDHPVDILRESAVLAIRKLEKSDLKKSPFSKYYSRDPAYPFEGTFEEALVMLFGNAMTMPGHANSCGDHVVDAHSCVNANPCTHSCGAMPGHYIVNDDNIEDKYRAIFYFRDLNTPEAVDALGRAFAFSSELLRHEIAYVFGQMENPLSVRWLTRVLLDEHETDIVRHEAAEALGNIGTEEALACLEKFVDSDIAILKESAMVGLGISEMENEDYASIEKLN